MKKTLLTALAALTVFLTSAQFTIDPGVWKIITINGVGYRIFAPADYNTGSNYYFHIAFYGDGEEFPSQFNNAVPGNLFISPHNWNGEVHMNNGTVAKFIILGIPAQGIQPNMYGAAIDSVFKVLGNKVDINNSNYFSASGFSGGPGRMWTYLIDASSSKRLLFQNTISMSPTPLGIDVTARSSTGRHWVWYADKDKNPKGTPPSAAINLYNDIGSSEKILTNQILPDSCHCNQIWDSCMSVAGVSSQNGGNANTNRWRWLVDPNDGITPPQPSSPTPFVVGQLRQKSFSGKNFLYYLPDTAQRATLKHYFIYNIVDTIGGDSAHAVQRGLAKKYRDGWDGRLPLCNGDTAIFSMFTQLNEPHLKATMELGIQLALDSLPYHIFDTAFSRRMRNIFTGIGRGPTTQLTYLMNKFIGGQGTANLRKSFGVFVSVDQHDNGHISSNGWVEVGSPLKSWWWTSNLSPYPYMPSTSRVGKDSADNRNPGAMTKITEIAASFSPITWDSAYSTKGSTPSNNVFLWIVDTSACNPIPPATPEGPFVVGQLRKKTYNNRELLYYVPDTAQRATLQYYFLYNMLDVAGQDSAYAVQRGLAKKYKNGWNGKLPLCNGDTAVFTMVTQIQNPHLKADMETGIQWALDTLPTHVFDTAYANRMKNVFTGIGYGPNSELTYLMNKFSVLGQGTAVFRKSFGIIVSLDQKDNGFIASDGWAAIEPPLRSWWWTSNLSGYPYFANYSRDCKDSADNRNPGKATKITELAENYSQLTWDSAYSILGSTAANNVFRWIADTTECEGMGRQAIFTEARVLAPERIIPGQLLITPNPATNRVNIAWTGEGGKAEILVLDMQGKVLHRQTTSSVKGKNMQQLNVHYLAKGTYILKLSSGQHSQTQIFQKN
jgi:hypothetical protein